MFLDTIGNDNEESSQDIWKMDGQGTEKQFFILILVIAQVGLPECYMISCLSVIETTYVILVLLPSDILE
jgi:hypothetical protein